MFLLELAYHPILGFPIIFHIGLLAFLGLSFSAFVGVMNVKGIQWVSMKWHMKIAKISMILVIIHVILAFMAYI